MSQHLEGYSFFNVSEHYPLTMFLVKRFQSEVIMKTKATKVVKNEVVLSSLTLRIKIFDKFNR